jgi:hypothetical protein
LPPKPLANNILFNLNNTSTEKSGTKQQRKKKTAVRIHTNNASAMPSPRACRPKWLNKGTTINTI